MLAGVIPEASKKLREYCAENEIQFAVDLPGPRPAKKTGGGQESSRPPRPVPLFITGGAQKEGEREYESIECVASPLYIITRHSLSY